MCLLNEPFVFFSTPYHDNSWRIGLIFFQPCYENRVVACVENTLYVCVCWQGGVREYQKVSKLSQTSSSSFFGSFPLSLSLSLTLSPCLSHSIRRPSFCTNFYSEQILYSVHFPFRVPSSSSYHGEYGGLLFSFVRYHCTCTRSEVGRFVEDTMRVSEACFSYPQELLHKV